MSRLNYFVGLVILISLTACGVDEGVDEDENEGVCEIGQAEPCECAGLPPGFVICDDGNQWEDCECPPPPTNGLPVTVGSLMWQTSLGPSSTPAAAVTYCEGYSEAGHSDWRLPTKAEFETFFSDCKVGDNGYIRCDGACNDAKFCSSAPATWYRTSTAAGSGEHYIVHTGRSAISPIEDSFAVSTICVRDVS